MFKVEVGDFTKADPSSSFIVKKLTEDPKLINCFASSLPQGHVAITANLLTNFLEGGSPTTNDIETNHFGFYGGFQTPQPLLQTEWVLLEAMTTSTRRQAYLLLFQSYIVYMLCSQSSHQVLIASTSIVDFFPFLYLILLVSFSCGLATTSGKGFSLEEATVHDLQLAFQRNQLTSRQLVDFYLEQIHKLNPILKGVLEVNPDALAQADRADQERRAKSPGSFSGLHGIPILLKDNIATKDKLNTTAGSFALLGSVVPRDAGVVTRLRKAGAIILGKASLSEWSNYRSNGAPSGWSARGGQGKNPYTMDDPCGSSSGSAISVAANLVAVSLGTETDGSILCPSDFNSVVGIKPTVGLTSRSGVVPISPRQDTVGPICRTVSDAAYVLETIAGIDTNDEATIEASKYVPKEGYSQFLKKDGLSGKRLGVVRLFYNFGNDTFLQKTYELHLKTLRQTGAVLVDNLEIDNINEIRSDLSERIALEFEFKLALNAYLKDLVSSPVRSLADVIAFNKKHPKLEKLDEYGQDLMLRAQKTNGIGKTQNQALLNMTRLSQNGFEKLMITNKLDAVVVPRSTFSSILAIGGYPGVIVPAGYEKGAPFGICFGGLKGSEPKLIEIAYSFEQATKIRKPPPLQKLKAYS